MAIPLVRICTGHCPQNVKLPSNLKTKQEKLEWIGGHLGHCVRPHPNPATPVLLLAHNADVYIEHILPKILENIKHACQLKKIFPPRLYVYENNSTDNTKHQINLLSKKFDVVSIMENCPKEMCSTNAPSRSSKRCAPIARMRNAVRAMAMRDIIVSPLTIVLDCDIWIKSESVMSLIDRIVNKEAQMATAFTLESDNHYYDTYAFVNVGEAPMHVRQRRLCPHDACRRCAGRLDDKCICRHSGIYKVRSAFAGFAVINSERLRGSRRLWRSHENKCEHVFLCRDIDVVVDTEAVARWEPKCLLENVNDIH